MTLEQRVEALRTALAEKFAPRNEPFKYSVERLSWENIRRGERHAFLQGASALAEVYRLEGKIKAFQELRDLRLVDRAISSNEALVRAQLEALLASLEAK